MPGRHGSGPLGGGHGGYNRGYRPGWHEPRGGWGWRPRPYYRAPLFGWGWRPRFYRPFPFFGGWGGGGIGCGLIIGLLLLFMLGFFACSLFSGFGRFSRNVSHYNYNTDTGTVLFSKMLPGPAEKLAELIRMPTIATQPTMNKSKNI